MTFAYSNAQLRILNNSLIEPTKNIAYPGLSNELTIQGLDVDSTYFLASSNDTVKSTKNLFFYFPKRLGYDTLQLYQNELLLGTYIFKIENLAKPRVFLGNIRDSILKIDSINSNLVLYVSYEPSLLKSEIRILNFNSSVIKKKGREKSLNEKSKINWDEWSEKKIQRVNDRLLKRNRIAPCTACFSKSQLKKIRKSKTLWIKEVVSISPSSMANRIPTDLKFTITK
jgi:hypothetical protein